MRRKQSQKFKPDPYQCEVEETCKAQCWKIRTRGYCFCVCRFESVFLTLVSLKIAFCHLCLWKFSLSVVSIFWYLSLWKCFFSVFRFENFFCKLLLWKCFLLLTFVALKIFFWRLSLWKYDCGYKNVFLALIAWKMFFFCDLIKFGATYGIRITYNKSVFRLINYNWAAPDSGVLSLQPVV